MVIIIRKDKENINICLINEAQTRASGICDPGSPCSHDNHATRINKLAQCITTRAPYTNIDQAGLLPLYEWYVQ